MNRRLPTWAARPIGVQEDGSVRRVIRHGDRIRIFRGPTGAWVATPTDGRVYLNQGLTQRLVLRETWEDVLNVVCLELRKLDGR
jgi:hypothetical protein